MNTPRYLKWLFAPAKSIRDHAIHLWKKRHESEYLRGYGWAARELLNRQTPGHVVVGNIHRQEYESEYNRGIGEALQDFDDFIGRECSKT